MAAQGDKFFQKSGCGSPGAGTDLKNSDGNTGVQVNASANVRGNGLAQDVVEQVGKDVIFIYPFHQVHGGVGKHHLLGLQPAGEDFRKGFDAGPGQQGLGLLVGVLSPLLFTRLPRLPKIV